MPNGKRGGFDSRPPRKGEPHLRLFHNPLQTIQKAMAAGKDRRHTTAGQRADLLTFTRMVQLHPVVPILAGRCRAHGRKRLGYRSALNEAPQAARCNCGCDGQPRGSILRQAARHGPPLRRLGRAQAHFPALVVQILPAAPPVCVLGILGIPPNRMARHPHAAAGIGMGATMPANLPG